MPGNRFIKMRMNNTELTTNNYTIKLFRKEMEYISLHIHDITLTIIKSKANILMTQAFQHILHFSEKNDSIFTARKKWHNFISRDYTDFSSTQQLQTINIHTHTHIYIYIYISHVKEIGTLTVTQPLKKIKIESFTYDLITEEIITI